MDRLHKYIFTSTDDCKTFKKAAVSFTPDEITFHPSNGTVVLAYDKTSTIKRVCHFHCFIIVLIVTCRCMPYFSLL